MSRLFFLMHPTLLSPECLAKRVVDQKGADCYLHPMGIHSPLRNPLLASSDDVQLSFSGETFEVVHRQSHRYFCVWQLEPPAPDRHMTLFHARRLRNGLQGRAGSWCFRCEF